MVHVYSWVYLVVFAVKINLIQLFVKPEDAIAGNILTWFKLLWQRHCGKLLHTSMSFSRCEHNHDHRE